MENRKEHCTWVKMEIKLSYFLFRGIEVVGSLIFILSLRANIKYMCMSFHIFFNLGCTKIHKMQATRFENQTL